MSVRPGRQLRVALLTPPGRFPTVVHDPGGWWPDLARRGSELIRLDLNAAWWRWFCSPDGYRSLRGHASFHGWLPLPGERAALDAGTALGQLQHAETYREADSYLDAVGRLARYLDMVSRDAGEVSVTWEAGPVSRTADYADSRSLLEQATRSGVFRRSVEAVLSLEMPMIDLLVVTVTSPEDLLTAMTTVSLVRQRQPQVHVVLADHGYENFSLRPHVEALRATGALTEVFDTILIARDERDAGVLAAADALATGSQPRGWVRLADLRAEPDGHGMAAPASAAFDHVLPPSESFTPEPVLQTRVSQRRCYWSRCTFCIHNAKYDDPTTPSLVEVDTAVRRFAAYFEAGYRRLIFLDEALSPALLGRLSQRLISSGLPERGLRWAGRSKLEMAHTPELFGEMRRAGCAEVLFGIESASERTLQLMDKHREGLTRDRVLEVMQAAADAGLGVHINLIAGFPGDGADDLADSLALVAAVGAYPNVTFTVNPLVVFPATPLHDDPARFNLELEQPRGDMHAIRGHQVVGDFAGVWRASMAALPSLVGRLRRTLEWDRLDELPGGRMALDLYFGTGHSVYFKALPDNPFAGGRMAAEHAGTR